MGLLGAVCVLFGFVGQVCGVCAAMCHCVHLVLSFRCRWRCSVCACVKAYSIHKGRPGEAKREREVFEEASVACSSLARGRPVSSALSAAWLQHPCKITQRPLLLILNSAAYSFSTLLHHEPCVSIIQKVRFTLHIKYKLVHTSINTSTPR